MKMTVTILMLCVLSLTLADLDEPGQLEKYGKQVKTYRLEVPGNTPITIIETAPDELERKWEKKHDIYKDKDDIEIRNLMTHIVHDINENSPRCYGPSCQEGFVNEGGPQKDVDDLVVDYGKLKDIRDIPMDRLQAISLLAAKLKKDKLKADRYSSLSAENDEEDGNGKVYTTWNRLKVKQHKHPYDDKDGWVSLEPIAWSTSKISKWKPNVKKPKPSNNWNEDEDRYSYEDDYPSNANQGMGYGNYQGNYQGMGSNYNYQVKKPAVMTRPGYINNKLHVSVSQDDTEVPSKPTWMKPQASSYTSSYPSSWSPDESRRPHKPSCETHDNYPNDDLYYGMSDTVVTDHRPSNFPYEYEALHQSSQRPMKRPTQVVYSGPPDSDDDRSSRPPYGDGQWVLLSTTKGYRNKKRQRSLSLDTNDHSETPSNYKSITSHQAVALTVLPVDNAHTNMTTSHGGLLEVEKSFKTVEESKRDMDKKDVYNDDVAVAESQQKPAVIKNRVVRKQVLSAVNSPDSSTLLAAVGAGMVPATMAMVVPMMLGRRRRRDVRTLHSDDDLRFHNELFKQQ